MAISEQDRHELHGRLEEVLGAQHAATLMAHLPPVAWQDLASKRDLVLLEERLGAKIEGLDAKIDNVDAKLGNKIEGLDAKIDTVDAKLGARIEALDAKVDGRYEALDQRVEAAEHRILGTLHREMNIQMRTTVLALGATASVIIAAVRL